MFTAEYEYKRKTNAWNSNNVCNATFRFLLIQVIQETKTKAEKTNREENTYSRYDCYAVTVKDV